MDKQKFNQNNLSVTPELQNLVTENNKSPGFLSGKWFNSYTRVNIIILIISLLVIFWISFLVLKQ